MAGGPGCLGRRQHPLPARQGPSQTVASDGTWDRIHTHLLARADAAGELDWDVSVDSTINRAHQHATRGLSSDTNLARHGTAPPDHGIGRSRGGLSTKIHHLTDGRGRPLVMLVGPARLCWAPSLPGLLATSADL